MQVLVGALSLEYIRRKTQSTLVMLAILAPSSSDRRLKATKMKVSSMNEVVMERKIVSV